MAHVENVSSGRMVHYLRLTSGKDKNNVSIVGSIETYYYIYSP